MDKIILTSTEELTEILRFVLAEERQNQNVFHKKDRPDSDNEQLFTTKEACRFLHISRATIYNLINKQSLSVKKIGRKNLFLKQDLNNFLNQKPIII